MLNVYDYIANSRCYKTFKVDDLLFVEYKCAIRQDAISYWTHNNYFAYLLSGETRYVGARQECVLHEGEAIFIRKGTYVAERNGPGEYCALFIFVPDDFIKRVMEKYAATANAVTFARRSEPETEPMFPLRIDDSLAAYFHSVLGYFRRDVAPGGDLLRIKFEELLLNILTGPQNQSLAQCLCGIRECGKVSLRDVMETSFMFPMSLNEYARLCARSLSSFKSDFYEIYKTSPGKWLITARLQYAKALLETGDESVNDIGFKSGFKNTAHFVKVFKEAYGMPPHQYRLNLLPC